MAPSATQQVPPLVPNHEMVRIIGRGAYGEIWLARSLTGTWRAVKIVDRRTFESEKAFQREFEGMSKFEPISRSDAGFVDILHVGRDDAGGFFFYVMELADDHLSGPQIDPENYVPKTLKTELARRARLLVDECLTIGLSLTKALAALHRQGLVHRDIKPANIIFVGGTPKIADIGLVAATGQNSFVGTEGYVPQEGPGTAQADIYSLGKVLYEIAMGKDRMDFPKLNTRLDEMPDKAALLRLNEVLLRACANDPAERYTTVEEMHADLALLREGRPVARRAKGRWPLIAVALLLAAIAVGALVARQRMGRGAVTIETDPPGAMVVWRGTMKRSPAHFESLPAGPQTVRVMLAGFEPVEEQFEVVPDGSTQVAPVRLQRSRGAAEIRSQPAGATFELRQGDEVVARGTAPAQIDGVPVGTHELWARINGRELREQIEIRRGETALKEIEFASGKVSITSKPAGAEISVNGQRAGIAPLELMLGEGRHELVAKYRVWPEQRRSITAHRAQPAEAAFEFSTGSVKLTSSPGGAQIFSGGKEIGRTPLLVEDLEPGHVSYELRLSGFKPLQVGASVTPGEQTFVGARFVKRAGPQRGGVWENSLGMKFVPVGEVLMCIWPTRVRDFEAYCQATARGQLVPDFPQEPDHPVVRVSWEDASGFCEWLTKAEIDGEQLEAGQLYRLPSDVEWSMAAGLPDEGRTTPEERDGKSRDFPWGRQWPPPAGAGNFADSALKRSGTAVIPGYSDGFAQTAPAGSFPANRLGLHDIAGNVWQWCLEPYKPGSRWGVLRGGSWATATAGELRSSYRNVVDRGERDVIYGFRCVLVPESGR